MPISTIEEARAFAASADPEEIPYEPGLEGLRKIFESGDFTLSGMQTMALGPESTLLQARCYAIAAKSMLDRWIEVTDAEAEKKESVVQ